MTPYRFWRVHGVETVGFGVLRLAELQLFVAGSRVDTSATLSCTHAPASGTLASLADADLSTSATWSRTAYSAPGFALVWDFGVGNTAAVDAIKLGAATVQAEFANCLHVAGSADGVQWVAVGDVIQTGAAFMASTLLTFTVSEAVAAAWNLSDKSNGCTLSNGALTASANEFNSARSTTGKAAGAWYCEFRSLGNRYPIVGVATSAATLTNLLGEDATEWAYYGLSAKKINANTQTTYGTTWTSPSDVIGMALDMGAGTLTFYKNGTTMGVAFTGLTGTLYAACGGDSGADSNVTANFGATAFAYTPPAGHSAWGAPVTPNAVLAMVDLASPGRTNYETAELGAPGAVQVAGVAQWRDMQYGGAGVISGTVKIDAVTDIPVRRRVRLVRDRDGAVVRETWSDAATGAYTFTGIDERERYSAISYDHTHDMRAVIADNLAPEVAA